MKWASGGGSPGNVEIKWRKYAGVRNGRGGGVCCV